MPRFSVWTLAVAMSGSALVGASLAADPADGPPPRQNEGGPVRQDQGGPGGQGQGGPGRQGQGGPGGSGGRPGGQSGGAPAGGVQLIPRYAEQKLNLTEDQKAQIAALEKETKDKLATILTAEQQKALDEAKPQRGPGGQGGPGGPGGQGQGVQGPGGQGQGGPGRGSPGQSGNGGRQRIPGGPGGPGGAARRGPGGPAPTNAGSTTAPAAQSNSATDSNPRTAIAVIPATQPQAKEPTIQWYATLARGLAEAKRTDKPVLFVSGNPSCAGVSGMWCPGKGSIDANYMLKPEVIAAAKSFVCIRLTTYENADESAFMSSIVQGNVSNTSFSILSPDGKPLFAKRGTGKGPGEYFKDSADMAQQMDGIAKKFPGKKADGAPALPVALSAKVGLLVAAADSQPLVIVLAEDASRRQALEAKVSALAWDGAFAGRFVYATAASMNEIPKVQGHTIDDGIILIEPDMFGSGGKVFKEVEGSETTERMADALHELDRSFVPIVKANRHDLTQAGLKEGIFYETGIPVSGKGEANDRDRYKKKLESVQK